MSRSTAHESVAREVDCLSTIGHLAGSIAHDINNPLAGIQNSFLLVKDAIPETHPHFKYVAAIEREIKRIAVITHGLVDMYPADYDRHGMLSVSSIVADALRLALATTGASAARVVVNNPLHILMDITDACLLRHALRLLLVGALKASGQVEPVHLVVTEDGDMLVFNIRYNGPMPSPRLRTEPYPGRLIEVLQGEWAASEDDGATRITMRVRTPGHGPEAE